ncbi:MAG: hypothetical protein WCB31_06750 [Nitrososphaeraceae archaeon]
MSNKSYYRFNQQNKKRYWHLLMTDENREKLKSRGRAGDSFNDVISQLLKQTAVRSDEKT